MGSTEITATRTIRSYRRLMAAVALLAVIALVPGTAPADAGEHGADANATATGGGHYLLAFGNVDLPGRLSFAALERADGTGHGRFRIELDLVDQLGGGVASFRGEVTCLTVDASQGVRGSGEPSRRTDRPVTCSVTRRPRSATTSGSASSTPARAAQQRRIGPPSPASKVAGGLPPPRSTAMRHPGPRVMREPIH